MKDENGIEICCKNCAANAQRDCNLWNAERGKVGSNGCREYFYPSYKAYEARIAELQAENALLKESRFTNNELDLIRNTFQSEIREDKCGWSAEKRIIAKCNELLKERKD